VKPIYLDYHATTPLDARVLDAMLPYFMDHFGNSHSQTHSYGWQAEAAVDGARERIAELLGVEPSEIVFTSGATESNNLGLRGVMEASKERGRHLLTVATEHKAVLDTAAALQRDGYRTTCLPVDGFGRIAVANFASALAPDTVLASVMHANNEIGTIQPIAELAAACHERGALLHTDAAQSFGKIPCDVGALDADLLSLSGHKLYGPKGVGVLVVRRRVWHRIRALQHGGGHENGLRSGTLPVPLIVGLAEAMTLCAESREGEAARLGALRDRLWATVAGALDELWPNGHPTERLPHNLNISVGFVEPDALLMSMPELAVSSGSACTSSSDEPSFVLEAIGRPRALATAAVRFGLGRFTTEAHIDTAAEVMIRAVRRLRALSPLWTDRERARVA
jgi:cysteine desulfurase